MSEQTQEERIAELIKNNVARIQKLAGMNAPVPNLAQIEIRTYLQVLLGDQLNEARERTENAISEALTALEAQVTGPHLLVPRAPTNGIDPNRSS